MPCANYVLGAQHSRRHAETAAATISFAAAGHRTSPGQARSHGAGHGRPRLPYTYFL